MKRQITSTALVSMLFFTSFNSVIALTYARSNWTLNSGFKSVDVSSSTIWVPDNYTTIQEAVNNASEQDTIFVRAGTYYEHVVVNKTLSLVGENKHDTVVDGGGTGTVVSVKANNVTLRGFNVQNGALGIRLEGSRNSILTDNIVSSKHRYGIYLYFCSNNVISGSHVSNNSYGIFVGDSDNNVISGSHVSNNSYGIQLSYCSNNVISGSHVSNNSYGISIFYSDNNVIFHNNFVNNTEPLTNIDSVTFFDNGVEGNYWSDYDGTDWDWDGIGDTPYTHGENSQDHCPLIGPFSEFDVMIGNQSYTVGIVCNSTISNFQCYYDATNQTNVVSFVVNGIGSKGFCRICIPHALIEPPYAVTIDQNPPLYNNTVRTNGTRTWMYFTYDHPEREVVIIHYARARAFWSEWWFWTIIALVVIVVVLLSLSIKQKKAIRAYEREMRSHLYKASALFKADVEKRRAKIEDFKRKYGVKIRTADTLEDFFRRWEFKKKVKH